MSSSSSPCAACKLQRRKCIQGCVFAPYFPPDQPSRFANVHKVFGASNVSKLLNDLPQAQREDAVNSLCYEADARLHDPVYGCVSYISILQLKIKQVRDEIAAARKELAGYIGPAAFSPIVAPPLHHPAAAQYHNAAASAQYAAGMGLGVGVAPPHAHQAQMAMQHPRHQQQMVEAQHMAAAVEVEREQDMMMRQAYAHAAVPGGGPAGAATVAVVPPGSAEAAVYEGAPFFLQHQPPPSAQTAVSLTYRMEPSPPPQSSGQSHAQQQHTDGSDEGSGGAAPTA